MLFNAIIFVLGVATHRFYLSNGEHHLHGLLYLQILISIVSTTILTLIFFGLSLDHAINKTSTPTLLYLCGLTSSLFLSRTLLSPLSAFPGPFLAKISALHFSLSLRASNAHDKLLKLHRRYGDFVRIGSSDLSITHPAAIDAIYGRGSPCTKAAWYDLTHPMTSLQTTRSRDTHDKRRRLWSAAFSDAAVRGYEQRIATCQDQLISYIDARENGSVDANQVMGFYNFDIMGDLAFGTSFGMLKGEKEHWAVVLLHRGLEGLGLMLPIWAFRVLLAIPGAMKDWFAFMKYCCEQLQIAIEVGALRVVFNLTLCGYFSLLPALFDQPL
ncbi:MAG: hypothetical protein Q9195_007779 [Heterodermia aff. obscurata]